MQTLFDHFNELMDKGAYIQLKQELNEENAADLAEYFEELSAEKQLFIFRLLTKDMAAEVFSYMDSDTQEHIVHSITDKEVRNIVDEMFLDDTVDFLEEAPANLVKKVLRNTDAETRALINRFLNYPENSAGSLMTIEFVKLRGGMTVDVAMKQIKRTGMDKETIYTCYVIDGQRKLIGVVPLRTLICAKDEELVQDLMEEDVVSVHTTDDQEEVAQIFKKYNWMALPVTDLENRLVGIITVDDIVDVIEQETTEDMEKMAALLPSDEEYLKPYCVAVCTDGIRYPQFFGYQPLSDVVGNGYGAFQLHHHHHRYWGERRLSGFHHDHSWYGAGRNRSERRTPSCLERSSGRRPLRHCPGGSQYGAYDIFQPQYGIFGRLYRFHQYGSRCSAFQDHRLYPANSGKDFEGRPSYDGRPFDFHTGGRCGIDFVFQHCDRIADVNKNLDFEGGVTWKNGMKRQNSGRRCWKKDIMYSCEKN